LKKPIPFGKYYLLERINVGGMAEVFRAKAYGVEGFERLVAVKRILPNIAEDKDFITMFVDEAKIAVQLNHANIAQIFDLGVVDGAYYIALEHIFGRDLRAIYDRCRQIGEAMPIAQACFVLMKVCEGLDYAHNKRDQAGRELNLVHRDVSPQNILVSFEGEVKLIDFGIAKAAGKGSKTQAGILKGKFGYMSPEQVRGLPIDRRSDIFACGIVLYELLTGERLFVGESDFSTLEKVRNVEILPPSTYNRRIPPELERIVLKALSKDVEDRYQNAIDLHDELQAFVYTAGEFYSRKDLAAWMKNTFSREIAAEGVKMEEFRQLPPPRGLVGGHGGSANERSGRRATPSMPLSVDGGASDLREGFAARADESGELEWDDDELETQIYDDEPAPLAAAPGAAVADAVGVVAGGGEPDLSSLVPSSAHWPSDAPPRPGVGVPGTLANGSNNTPSPFTAELDDDPPPPTAEPSAVARLIGEARARSHGPGPSGGTFPPAMPPQLAPMSPPPSRMPWLVGAILLILLLAGGAVALLMLSEGDRPDIIAGDQPRTVASGSPEPAAAPAPTDLDTGFDVIVSPAGARIKLDGDDVGPAPRRVRNIAGGSHVLELEAEGYFPKREQVEVAQGEARTIRIALEPIEVLARFASEPPGATVTLISEAKRTSLGTAPAEAKLDPRARYEVVFQRDGYVTITRPVEMDGSPELAVAVVMERVGGVASRDETPTRAREPASRDETSTRAREPAIELPRRDAPEESDPPRSGSSRNGPTRPPPRRVETARPAPEPAEPGRLMLGSKPPCKIFIDGQDTGLTTPQRDLEVPAGTHKITFVNNEFRIKVSESITVNPGEEVRVIKDFTDQIE
jgi:serine/threonine protein kinase